MNIAIVFGGPTVEHDISIITARQIFASIDKKKYNVTLIYYSKQKKFYEARNFDCVKNFTGDIKLMDEITINRLGVKKKGNFKKIKSIDCYILSVHGKNTEGGELAGFFEILGIPYSSSSVLGASLGQDKITMKKVLKYDGINVLDFVSFSRDEFIEKEQYFYDEISKLNYPVIVKPSTLGSSIGVRVVNDEKQLKKALNYAFKYDDFVLIEKALRNFREFNCAIMEKMVSNIEEVEVNNEIFSFEDKYESKKSKHILPALINEDLEQEITKLTIKTSASLRNESIARIDFLYDNDEEKLYVNEINTIPGALAYYLFESKGIYFDELLDKLIINAIKKDYKKNKLTNYFNSSVLDSKNNLKMKK